MPPAPRQTYSPPCRSRLPARSSRGGCVDQFGSETLLFQFTALPLVVAVCDVDNLTATMLLKLPPVQYNPSDMRCNVNVVVLAFSSAPPELSAALPVNGLEGPVPTEKLVPSSGLVTDA